MTFTVTGYRVDQLLGRGSQAEVWAGQVSSSGERVALKRIVTDSTAAARAGRAEAALLAVLDHPNLIRLREFLTLDSGVVLVLELAEAGSLAALLRRRGKLSPAEVVATISPVAAALAHAHGQGVLHADVSPANILFTAAGQPKLADLGVARLLGSRVDTIGTPAYLDPTVAAGGVLGPAGDVFALGAVALHALTGAGPWQCPGVPEPSAEQVLAVAATGEIAGLTDRLSCFEPALAAVIARVLDPDPFRRPTAAEFALDLRAALQPVPVVLAGGRILPRVGRHSVERALANKAFEAGGDRCADAAGRPEFRPAVPGRLPGDVVPADLTQVQRPRVRAALAELAATEPDRKEWRSILTLWHKQVFNRWPAWRPGRVLLAGATMLALLAWWLLGAPAGRLGHRTAAETPASAIAGSSVAAVPGLVSQPGGVTSGGVSSAASKSGGVSSAGVSSAASKSGGVSSAGVSSGSPQPGGMTSAGSVPSAAAPVLSATAPGVPIEPVAALAALDRIRAQAYVQRQVGLLAQVYSSPALLAQDTAELTRTVPAGCGLSGLRTSYADLDPTASTGDRVQLQVTARLAAGSLVCAGRPGGRTAAAGPIRLSIVLSRTVHGIRISAEQLVRS